MNVLLSGGLAAVLALAGCAGCAGAPTASTATTPPVPAGMRAPAAGIVTGGRIAADDIEALRRAGIAQVIDLTPDAETPDFDEAAAVGGAGLAYANLPLRGGVDLTIENVRAFAALLDDARRPVLVHCASGNRVGAMAALKAAWIDGQELEQALATGRAWGLTGLQDEVRRRIEAGPGATP